MAAMESFRQLIAWLQEQGQLASVERRVAPRHELTAVMR
jgi:3-polyprenyl-4-hydroxybenzoate decarboxylase